MQVRRHHSTANWDIRRYMLYTINGHVYKANAKKILHHFFFDISINDRDFHSCSTGWLLKIYDRFVFYLSVFSWWSVLLRCAPKVIFHIKTNLWKRSVLCVPGCWIESIAARRETEEQKKNGIYLCLPEYDPWCATIRKIFFQKFISSLLEGLKEISVCNPPLLKSKLQ